jgi:hypothetical protein
MNPSAIAIASFSISRRRRSLRSAASGGEGVSAHPLARVVGVASDAALLVSQQAAFMEQEDSLEARSQWFSTPTS